MYGLSQSVLLSQKFLKKVLNKQVYKKSNITPGLWMHESRPISFTLCVDEFGVKYVEKKHAYHLMAIIKDHYKISYDCDGKKYLGLELEWYYDNREAHLSILN